VGKTGTTRGFPSYKVAKFHNFLETVIAITFLNTYVTLYGTFIEAWVIWD
jgi:hypothetical protein